MFSLQGTQNRRNITTTSGTIVSVTSKGGVNIEAYLGRRTVSGGPYVQLRMD